MSLGVAAELENGLTVCCDWISFTVLDKSYSVNDVCAFLGYSRDDFADMPKGGNGYKSMIKLGGYPVMILFDGKNDMGIHVSISGTAINEVMSHYRETHKVDSPFDSNEELYFNSWGIDNFLAEVLNDVSHIGQLSRLDLAIDDKSSRYFNLDDIHSFIKSGQVVSKFRGYRHVEESSLSGDRSGHGFYFGSRTSDIMLRVYDKKIEQEKKKNPVESDSWYRWEFELKNERANQVAKLIIGNSDIGTVMTGILNNYFRIIELDNENRSRCSMNPIWAEFVSTLEKLKLSQVKPAATIEKKKYWFVTQCAPTLAGLIVADNFDFGIVTDYIDNYILKMSRDMRDILQRVNPDWENQYYANVS